MTMDNEILGKPKGEADAIRMLQLLQNKKDEHNKNRIEINWNTSNIKYFSCAFIFIVF